MKLVFICDQCKLSVVLFHGHIESTPSGSKLHELIAIAHDQHKCEPLKG